MILPMRERGEVGEALQGNVLHSSPGDVPGTVALLASGHACCGGFILELQENTVMASTSKRVQRVLTQHDEIQDWAQTRGASPACVKGTEREEGSCLLRLDFPGYTGEQSLHSIAWDQWFRVFDQRQLALIVEDKMADGKPSNFNKLVSRESAHA